MTWRHVDARWIAGGTSEKHGEKYGRVFWKSPPYILSNIITKPSFSVWGGRPTEVCVAQHKEAYPMSSAPPPPPTRLPIAEMVMAATTRATVTAARAATTTTGAAVAATATAVDTNNKQQTTIN